MKEYMVMSSISMIWPNRQSLVMFSTSMIWPYRLYTNGNNCILAMEDCDSTLNQKHGKQDSLACFWEQYLQGLCQLAFDYYNLLPTTTTVDLKWSLLLIFCDETLMRHWFWFNLSAVSVTAIFPFGYFSMKNYTP